MSLTHLDENGAAHMVDVGKEVHECAGTGGAYNETGNAENDCGRNNAEGRCIRLCADCRYYGCKVHK